MKITEWTRGPEVNLGGILRVRRDLAEAIRNVVVAGVDVGLDKFDLLLDLFRAAKGLGYPVADPEGFVTFRALQISLVSSQSQVSRQINELVGTHWAEVRQTKRGQAHHGNSLRAHISGDGQRVMQQVWERLRALGENVFESVSPSDRAVHYHVNQTIRAKLRPIYRIDGYNVSTHPVDNILSILKASRELIPVINRFVLTDFPRSLEEADILVDLYGAWKLRWPDPRADGEGFVTFENLRVSLVHSQTLSQILVSRRARQLAEQGLLHIQKRNEDQKYLGKSDGLRITNAGIETIAPVWEKYKELAASLLGGVLPKSRQTHWSVNESVLQRLRPAWSTLG